MLDSGRFLNMDEQKRLQLQEMFKKGLENLTILKPGDPGYVSKFQTSEVKPFTKPQVIEQITLKEFNKRVEKFKKSIQRKVWSPVISQSTKDDPQQSKYFGDAWCYEDDRWPQINGGPATFVMQIDLASVPEYVRKILGKNKNGLLQFFYQTNEKLMDFSGDDALIRILDKTKPGKLMKQPDIYNNYFEIPDEKFIIGWQEGIDYPHNEDLPDFEGYDELNELALGNSFEWDDAIPAPYQGDKLFGYPFWYQASDGIDDYLYQLDCGSFFDSLSLPAHAPKLFSPEGTGHIFLEKGKKNGFFTWSS